MVQPLFKTEAPHIYLVPSEHAETPQPLVRAGAYLIDAILVGVASAIVSTVMLLAYFKLAPSLSLTPLALRNPSHIKIFRQVVSFLIFTAYMALSLWYTNGFTVGKKLCGLRVVQNNGVSEWSFLSALKRALCYQVSYLPLGLGFAWAFVRSDRKTWHDLISKTSVVTVKNLDSSSSSLAA